MFCVPAAPRRYHTVLDAECGTHVPCPACGGCLTCGVHWDELTRSWLVMTVPERR